MKKHHAIALGAAVAAALLVTASCGNKEVEEDTLTRLSQAVEGNYVDTMILRLTDFRRQTISNGKLVAARKSLLRFNTSGTISEVNFTNGQSVRKGDLIACLDPEAASITLAQAENALKKAEIDLNDVLIGFGYGNSDTTSVPAQVMAIARTRSGYADAEQNWRKAPWGQMIRLHYIKVQPFMQILRFGKMAKNFL